MTDNDANVPSPDPAGPRFTFMRTDEHHLDVLRDGRSVATACLAGPGTRTLSIEPEALAEIWRWNRRVLRTLLATSDPIGMPGLIAALIFAGLPETEAARVGAS